MRSAVLLACLAACLAAASATHICNSGFAEHYEANAAGTAYPGHPAVTALAPRVLARGLESQGCRLVSATYWEACADPKPNSTPTRFLGDLAFGAEVVARCATERYPQKFDVLAEVEVGAPFPDGHVPFKTLTMDILPVLLQ